MLILALRLAVHPMELACQPSSQMSGSVSCSPRAELLGIRLEGDVLLAGLITEHDGERLGELLELGEGEGGGLVFGGVSFSLALGGLGLLSCQRSPLRRPGMAPEKVYNDL
jgi:hypothetical protein